MFNDKRDLALSLDVMYELVNAAARINLRILRAYPHTPPLYLSGVVYREEPPGEEDWKDCLGCLHDGWGDCDDLAPWRIAEHWRNGVAAFPAFRWMIDGNGKQKYHILVGLPGGHPPEDPSARLGMKE